jgi:hypothetical protein
MRLQIFLSKSGLHEVPLLLRLVVRAFSALGTACFLQDPILSTLDVVQVLATKLYHLLSLLYRLQTYAAHMGFTFVFRQVAEL